MRFAGEPRSRVILGTHFKDLLQNTEHSVYSWNDEDRGSEFTYQFLPHLSSKAALVGGEGSQQLKHARDPMGREIDGQTDGFEDPSQNDLYRGPHSAHLPNLLE
jgi:hypothetical protein